MGRLDGAGHGAHDVAHNPGSPHPPALLALYPGLRQTGWAVLRAGGEKGRAVPPVAASGVVGFKPQQKIDDTERIARQLEALTSVVARWRPASVVCSKPGSMNWRVPGREQLEEALSGWAAGLGLPLTDYTAPEVRAAVAGQPNASKDALGYAVMLYLGLIGQSRATAEWEAIAVGCHHLQI